MIATDSSNDPAVNRMSVRVVDTADSARSTRDSILSLYGHRSYYQKILDPREAPFAMALELQVDYARVSRIIEDHLEDDPQPECTASNAVDEGLEVHALASTKFADSSKESEFDVHANPGTKPVKFSERADFFESLRRYPGRAKAIKPYYFSPLAASINENIVTFQPSSRRLSFAQNEVLQVKDFSGPIWQVRKNTGVESIVPSDYLIPHYPYLGRARFNFGHENLVLENEILHVSDEVEYRTRPNEWWSLPSQVWRPWRKKTGEMGIAPDSCFYPIEKPLPPLPPLPSSHKKLHTLLKSA